MTSSFQPATLARAFLTTFGLVALAACSAPGESAVPTDDSAGPISSTCTVAAPPAYYGNAPFELDLTFYTQSCEIAGVPIVASANVDPAALQVTAEIVATMMTPLSQTERDGMRSIALRVGVIGENEVTTDMPEYADLNDVFPGTDWDGATRGLGATPARPLTSSGEENLLCLAGDPYFAENILIHEFSHTVHEYGVVAGDPTFQGRLDAAYDAAMNAGLWSKTYGATNSTEYWAEGVQSYFEVNGSASPADGIHNDVDTRAELQSYDAALYALVDEVFAGATIDPPCP